MPQRSEFSTEDAAIKPDGREESAEQPNEHQPVLPPEDAPSADEAEEVSKNKWLLSTAMLASTAVHLQPQCRRLWTPGTCVRPPCP